MTFLGTVRLAFPLKGKKRLKSSTGFHFDPSVHKQHPKYANDLDENSCAKPTLNFVTQHLQNLLHHIPEDSNLQACMFHSH